MRVFALALVLAPLPASATLAQTPDAAPVVAAERAFAADAPGMGITASFTKWSVDDAVVISQGQARTVRDVYPPDAPRDSDEPTLLWWPNFAGIARSGDLGFTTGGVAVNGERAGHYFTIWKHQPDGGWKWVYDGGSGASAAEVPGPETEPEVLPLGRHVPGMTADAALAEIAEMEERLAAGLRTDQGAAHLAVLADRGRVYVAPLPPAIGPEQAAQALTGWPTTFETGPMEGGGASEAGDLVWTYAPALWMREGQPRTGQFVRLWQRQEDGWKLVLVQLIPGPPPPLVVTPPAGE